MVESMSIQDFKAMIISYKASPLSLHELSFIITNKQTSKQTNKQMRVTFIRRYPVAAVMCDVLRATNRQKVQRVILATFRVRDNFSSTPCS